MAIGLMWRFPLGSRSPLHRRSEGVVLVLLRAGLRGPSVRTLSRRSPVRSVSSLTELVGVLGRCSDAGGQRCALFASIVNTHRPSITRDHPHLFAENAPVVKGERGQFQRRSACISRSS